MKIDCSYSELIEINSPKIIPNPKNNNRHSIEQIERLAKIIDFQGQRSPVVISKRSGFIVKGHCRLEAIKLLGWEKIAVDYQDYLSEAQEYADMTADNEIARWAQLDVHSTILEMEKLEIDLDFLGIEKLPNIEQLDFSEKNEEIDTENFGNDLQHTCPKCGFEFNE